MKSILYYICFLLTFTSCNNEQKPTQIESKNEIKITKGSTDTIHLTYTTIPKIDKVIYSQKRDKLSEDGYAIYDYFMVEDKILPWLTNTVYSKLHPSKSKYMGVHEAESEIRMYFNNELINTFQIVNFRNDLHLVDSPRKLKTIDTTIFDSLIKYSSKIEKENYQFADINFTREIAEYCNQNNIAFLDNSLYPPKWPYFEGEFVFSYSSNPLKKNDDSIFQLIHSRIPKVAIHITSPNTAIYSDSAVWTYRAYCNESIHKIFKQDFKKFESISSFMHFKPSIQIIATKNQQLKIKQMIKTWANNT